MRLIVHGRYLILKWGSDLNVDRNGIMNQVVCCRLEVTVSKAHDVYPLNDILYISLQLQHLSYSLFMVQSAAFCCIIYISLLLQHHWNVVLATHCLWSGLQSECLFTWELLNWQISLFHSQTLITSEIGMKTTMTQWAIFSNYLESTSWILSPC